MRKHERHESTHTGFSVDRVKEKPSKAITYICGAIAAAVSTVSCANWEQASGENVGSVSEKIYQDAAQPLGVGQVLGNWYPNVIYIDGAKQNARMVYVTGQEGPSYNQNVWCGDSADGAVTFTNERRLNDSSLTEKVNSPWDENSVAVRKNATSYDLYFVSIRSGGNDVWVSYNFDIDNCTATQDAVMLPATAGLVNYGDAVYGIAINPHTNAKLTTILANDEIHSVNFGTWESTLMTDIPASLTNITGIAFRSDGSHIIGSQGGPSSRGGGDLNYISGGVATNLDDVTGMLTTTNDANDQMTPFVDEKGNLYATSGADINSMAFFKKNEIPTGTGGTGGGAGAPSTGGSGGSTGGTGGVETGGTGGAATGGAAGTPETGGTGGSTGGTGGLLTGGTGGTVETGGIGGLAGAPSTGGVEQTGGTGGTVVPPTCKLEVSSTPSTAEICEVNCTDPNNIILSVQSGVCNVRYTDANGYTDLVWEAPADGTTYTILTNANGQVELSTGIDLQSFVHHGATMNFARGGITAGLIGTEGGWTYPPELQAQGHVSKFLIADGSANVEINDVPVEAFESGIVTPVDGQPGYVLLNEDDLELIGSNSPTPTAEISPPAEGGGCGCAMAGSGKDPYGFLMYIMVGGVMLARLKRRAIKG